MSTAITGTTILQRAERWQAVSGVDLVLENGRIAACGAGASVGWPQAERIDGSRLLLTPGLVNAHCHSVEVLARGRAGDSGLQGWLAELSDTDVMSADEITLAINLCAADLLRSGGTSVIDHFRQLPATLSAGEAAAAAWSATGLRATLALMVRDGADADGRMLDAGYAGAPPSTASMLDLTRDWLAGIRPDQGVVRAASPSSPARCTADLLGGLADLARSHAAPFHTHVDEIFEQTVRARAMFGGDTAIATLDRVGALGPATTLVHCVHVNDDDIARIAASGATMVHCPVANMRLGSGIAPVARLRAAGASVALATDGAASNDAQSITEVVKAALLLSRVAPDAPGWLSADAVLDMAFRPGSRPFLGESDPLCGQLVAGAPADIAAFDLDDPVLVPANDLALQFALAGGGLRARHVWIGGVRRLADGEPLGVDLAALADVARARAHALAIAAVA